MSTWAIYNQATGRVTKHFGGSERQLALNIPAGHAAIPGRLDPTSQRVDPSTGEAVTWRAPAPSDDHEWSDTRRRYVLKPDAYARKVTNEVTLGKISELERRQARSQRELLLDPQNAEARRRLGEIENQIVELRKAFAVSV